MAASVCSRVSRGGQIEIFVDRLRQAAEQRAIAEEIGTHGEDQIGRQVVGLPPIAGLPKCLQQEIDELVAFVRIQPTFHAEDFLELVHQDQEVRPRRQGLSAHQFRESERAPAQFRRQEGRRVRAAAPFRAHDLRS